jgi:hypothetical protein
LFKTFYATSLYDGNAVVGLSSALHRRFELFAEYGFSPGDLTFFAWGVTFRF